MQTDAIALFVKEKYTFVVAPIGFRKGLIFSSTFFWMDYFDKKE